MSRAEDLYAAFGDVVRRQFAALGQFRARMGLCFGFTDHDRDLTFMDIVFQGRIGADGAGVAAKHGAFGRQHRSGGGLVGCGGDRSGYSGGPL